MTAVLDQVKNVAYASVGVNILVTDAIVGHEITTPDFAEEHTALARKQATEALTDLRARTEPQVQKFEARFPEQVATVMESNRTKAWDFIGISAPKAAKVVTPKVATPKATAPKAASKARKTAKRTSKTASKTTRA